METRWLTIAKLFELELGERFKLTSVFYKFTLLGEYHFEADGLYQENLSRTYEPINNLVILNDLLSGCYTVQKVGENIANQNN